MVQQKLTIVQILPELDEGGVEGETLDLAVYLAQQGHRSIVISGGGRMVKTLEEAGCIHVNWPYIGAKSLCCLKYLNPLRKYMLEENVDVVHLRSRLPAWIGYLAWKSLPQEKRPALITTFHGFYSVNCYSTIMTNGQRVVAVSQTIKNHILSNYKTGAHKIDIIHGGYDEEMFSPDKVSEPRINDLRNKWQVPKDIPVIMLPGRLTFWKGQELFIESLSLIKELPFFALCVGDVHDNPSYTKKLRESIKKKGLQDKIILAGHCDDMPAALMLSDIVVSASSSQPEAFGKVAIEAMAMKKTIIATAHGGSLETVVNGKTGWLVPPSDPLEMAEAFRKALDNRDTNKRMGEEGLKWVRQNFTARQMCEKSVALYKKVLSEKERQEARERLTVVQLVPELDGGGVERGTLEMGKHLIENGHRSIVISAGGRLVRQLEEEQSQHIKYHVGSKSPLALKYILPIRQLLLKEKVDVLHLRSRMPAWVGYMAWRSLPKNKRPVLITTFHGFYSVNSYSAIMTKGDGIIAVSEGIKKHIQEYYNIINDTTLIFRGVDTKLFNPENVKIEEVDSLRKEWGLDPDVPVVMLPGRITRLKGQDFFIKSLALIKEKPFQAVLVGGISENPGLVVELKQIIEENGLSQKVTFVDFCSNMPAAFSLADVVISASSTEPEAFGRTTVEAMAMAKPVIATAHGGSLETVVPGETGWLVNPSDSSDMASAIEHFLSLDDETVEQYGLAGQKRVREKFTVEEMCDQTVTLYKELISQQTKSIER